MEFAPNSLPGGYGKVGRRAQGGRPERIHNFHTAHDEISLELAVRGVKVGLPLENP
jgi:hypothetical protein